MMKLVNDRRDLSWHLFLVRFVSVAWTVVKINDILNGFVWILCGKGSGMMIPGDFTGVVGFDRED